MMAWGWLGANALWVTGLSLALAVLSIAHYKSRVNGRRPDSLLSEPGTVRALTLAGALFSLGLGILDGSGWGRILWWLLAGVFLLTPVFIKAWVKGRPVPRAKRAG